MLNRMHRRDTVSSYYWAYGSNLCLANMSHRCPDAVPVGPMYVTQAALVFRGVADVTIRKDSVVPGGLWRITNRCEEALDRYEGVGSRFYMKRYFDVKIDGRKRSVLFYQMVMDRGVMPPSQYYLDVIEQGYRDFNLDLDVLNQYVAQSWDDKEVTPVLRERHIRKGQPKLARANLTEAVSG